MNDLAIGSVLKYQSAPHSVLKADHVQMGRGGAIVRTKIKNLLTGQVLEITYKSGDKIEEASLDRRRATYLYIDESGFNFMDTQSFEQFALSQDLVGEKGVFLSENNDYDIMDFEGRPVAVQLPKKVELKVVETTPGVRGDTAQGSVTKPAKLSTGLTVNVPLFVKTGDIIRINTETQQYVERV